MILLELADEGKTKPGLLGGLPIVVSVLRSYYCVTSDEKITLTMRIVKNADHGIGHPNPHVCREKAYRSTEGMLGLQR